MNNIYEKNYGSRVELVRKVLKLKNQTEFAKILGVNQTTISKYEKGITAIPDETKLILSEKGINLHWLVTGMGDMFISDENKPRSEDKAPVLYQKEFSLFKFVRGHVHPITAEETDINSLVLLPVFGQPVSAGPGQGENQLSEIDAYLPIVHEMLGGANPRDCGIARVIGDSMVDMLLFDGDMVVFDRTRLEGSGVYVISVADEMRVKHIEYRLFEKKVIISSENAKRYPTPEVISYEQAENLLRVHGKVICWIHTHPY